MTSQAAGKTSTDEAERVYRAIRQKALMGGLDGQLLTEMGLAEQFGVSRRTVRKAVLRLRQEGILDSRKRLGTHVKEHTPEELLDYENLRLGLEIVAVRLAAAFITTDQVEVLRQFNRMNREASVRATRATTQEERKRHEIDALDAECRFHLALVAVSGNRMLLDACKRYNIHPVSRVNPDQFETDPGYAERFLHDSDRVIEEHEEIIEALLRRDADEAERLIRNHIGLRIADLRDIMKQEEARDLLKEISE